MDIANRPLPSNFMDTKTTKAPIVWIARNCQASSGRQHYVAELMKYIKVDSYSSCLNNQDFPNDKDRMELMSEYKFYLAIENANCDDYGKECIVTEKLFDTFLASTVPIVDGPKSYDGFIPNEKSIIRMDAYPDPRDLAAYIDYLDKNDTAYLEHLSFRTQVLDIAPRDRLDPSFIGNWSDPALHNQRNSWCSICRGMVPWWNARRNNGAPPLLDDNRLVVDDTCSPKGKWDYVLDGPPYIPTWEPSKPYTVSSANDSSSHAEQELDIFGTVDDITTARLVWMVEILAGALFISIVFGVTFKRRQLQRKSKQAKNMDHEMCI
ncbi:hypothetical protein K492DRAFT_124189 [Lichtheimia hyalospora FSU 10163]|nr:hypothetical protein K492DRAFT_124189 [Lichtheimia hyalospora FSU 10163]